MNDELQNILPSTAVLGAAGLIALFLILTRGALKG